jgi:hypothetical protein
VAKRKLCDWDKNRIDEKREKLIRIVSRPKFVCERCARVADKKEYLCKPSAIG